MLKACLEICSRLKNRSKIKCKRAKTTHVLTGAVAKDNIEELSKYLQPTWYVIATDGSSDRADKYLPVLIRYEGPDGLIQTSLLDMLDVNAGSHAQTMFNSINNAIKSAKFSWDYCVSYSSSNTNSMVGEKNNLLTKIKNAQQCGQSITDVEYPCLLAHLYAEKGAKELSLSQP